MAIFVNLCAIFVKDSTSILSAAEIEIGRYTGSCFYCDIEALGCPPSITFGGVCTSWVKAGRLGISPHGKTLENTLASLNNGCYVTNSMKIF